MTRAILVSAFFASALYARNQLSARYDNADEVVIAQPKAVRQIAERWFVEIVVEEALKGTLRYGATVSVDVGQVGGVLGGPGRRGILFLKRASPAGFSLLRIRGGLGHIEGSYYVTPVRLKPPSGSRGGVERIMFEIGAALEAPKRDFTPHVLYMAVYELCGDRLADPIALSLSRSPDPGHRALAAALGLCRGSVDSVIAVLKEPSVLFASAGGYLLRSSLAGITEYRPGVLMLFRHILNSTDPAVQKAIVDVGSSLAKVHSREVVPLMVQLLDDPRARVRNDALMGLSRFVDGYPTHTPEAVVSGKTFAKRRTEFATDETDRFNAATNPSLPESEHEAYVAAWKRWWTDNRAKFSH